ncbi:MAG: serine hydrolase domain-containing protein [Bacteroidota bacterium]
MLKKGKAALQDLKIEDRMKALNVPGLSLSYFKQGKVQWVASFGTLVHSGQAPVTKAALFQAASISKPVVAIGALQLVERGHWALDAPINQYLTQWILPENQLTQKRPVTLRHLLSHSSGIQLSGFDGYSAGATLPNLVDILDGTGPANSAPVRVSIVPGSQTQYAGGGYLVIQQLMEESVKGGFKAYMSEHVLKAAGMHNSFFAQPLPDHLGSFAAVGHLGDGTAIPGKWHIYPELAAAGLWTTSFDLALLITSILRAYHGSNDELLSPELAKELLSQQNHSWGLGVILLEGKQSKWLTHGGANLGYRSTVLANLDNSEGVVMMTNGNRGDLLSSEILRNLAQMYHWDIFKTDMSPFVELELRQLQKFMGTYVHATEEDYQIEISIKGLKLMVRQLWNHVVFPIYPEQQNYFMAVQDGRSFKFNTSEKGIPVELVIDEKLVLIKVK